MRAAGALLAASAVAVASYAAGRQAAREEAAVLRVQSRTDALTGLANRRALGVELRQRAAGREPYVLVLLDLDGFKAVNDRFGHDIGDAVLVEIGRRLSGLVRADDLVVRLGGDEFVIVAGSPAPAMGRLLAADVVRAVTAPLQTAGLGERLGVSVGVVQAWPGDAAAVVLRAADLAMYRAKAAGGGLAQTDLSVAYPPVDGRRPVVRLRDLAPTGRALAGVA